MCLRKLLGTTLQAVLVFLASAPFLLSQTHPKPPKTVRLYVFDNGMIEGSIQGFSISRRKNRDVGYGRGSYLIVHPKGTLMWDSGAIPDSDLKADASPVTQEYSRPRKR